MTSEVAKEFQQLESWKALCAEIDGLISFEEKKFMSCKPEELDAIRQKILAYESVKNLPKNIFEREEE